MFRSSGEQTHEVERESEPKRDEWIKARIGRLQEGRLVGSRISEQRVDW